MAFLSFLRKQESTSPQIPAFLPAVATALQTGAGMKVRLTFCLPLLVMGC